MAGSAQSVRIERGMSPDSTASPDSRPTGGGHCLGRSYRANIGDAVRFELDAFRIREDWREALSER